MTEGGTRLRLRDRLAGIGGGASLVPLAILFGLNAVDELDRTAFGLLLPEIRKHFGLNLKGVTALSAAVIPASLLIALPIARRADRRRRVPIAAGGAATWGLFSVFTGLAPTVALLGLARVGAGLGRAVNGPVHPSLLADYYLPSARAKVISVHRLANTVGQFAGPLIAGFVAAALGWRAPFYALAVPTFVLVGITITSLREPERTGTTQAEGDVRFRRALSVLWRIPTLRKLCLAFPFLSFVAIGLGQIFSLYYNDVFHVGVKGRGIIQAFDALFSLTGLIIGAVVIDRGIARDSGRTIRNIGIAAAVIGVFVIGAASAPQLWLAVLFEYAIHGLAAVLLVGGVTVVSLVAPPEVRATSFALFEIFALLGVLALPLVGAVGDAYGLRVGVAILTPFLLVGGAMVANTGRFVNEDIKRVYPERTPPLAPEDLLSPG